MAVDGLGHDPYHYARLNKNQELLAIVKTHLDNANRGNPVPPGSHGLMWGSTLLPWIEIWVIDVNKLFNFNDQPEHPQRTCCW
jgi:hypothetical protein